MELRSREVPGPWIIPTVRTVLEMEASLFDSDVQEFFAMEELVGDETTSGPQFQSSFRVS